MYYYGRQFDVSKCNYNYNNKDDIVFVKGFVSDIDKKDNYISMIITDGEKENFVETRYYGDIEVFKRAFILLKGEPVYYKDSKEHYINIDSVVVYIPPKNNLYRPELHARTSYTRKNGLGKIDEIIEYCDLINVSDIAFIDLFSVQNIPEAYEKLKKSGRKPVFGVEMSVVPERAGILNDVYDNDPMYKVSIYDRDYVVFDIETTNLSVRNGELLEIGAVRVRNGQILDSYHSLIRPADDIPKEITELTGITNEDVENARDEAVVLQEFLDFIGKDSILVAHNAEFDYNFIRKRAKDILLEEINYIYFDTLSFLRKNMTMKSYTLDKVVKKFKIESFDHHRADEDARVTAQIFLKILEIMNNELNIKTFGDLYKYDFDSIKQFGYNVVLIVKNKLGLRDLFELISIAHTETFYKIPKIKENKLLSMSNNLLIVSPANSNSEIYNKYLRGVDFQEMQENIKKYDYIEITSPEAFSIEHENLTKRQIQTMFRLLYDEANKMDIKCYYVSNSYYISKADKTFYKALVNFDDRYYDGQNHIRSPEEAYIEMMEIFENDVIAYDLVYNQPRQLIQYKVEEIKPLSGELHQPSIKNDKEKLLDIVNKGYEEKYLNIDDDVLKTRLKKELDSIIGNSFQVLYLIAYNIVEKSLEDGYTVGSRGSVGSSLVAYLMNITEVNPMPPHYFCKKCGYIEWVDNFDDGFDLPKKQCSCGNDLTRDGHKIPFETFLGFEGDKIPDWEIPVYNSNYFY